MDPPDNVHCTPHIKLTGAAAGATVGGREACGPFCCILQPRNMRFFLLFLLLCLIHRFLMSGTYSLESFFFFSLHRPFNFCFKRNGSIPVMHLCALYNILSFYSDVFWPSHKRGPSISN